jgi:glycine betaine/proline transport system ATP-binding protein
MALIEVQQLSTVFGPRPQASLAQARQGLDKAALLAQSGHTVALQDLSLAIQAGELFVIMGASGSGKSTLLRHLNGLIAPTEGRVWIDGQDVTALKPDQLVALRRQRLAMVFQDFGLLAHRNVLDNVALPLELRGVAKAQRRAQARQWLERVQLAGQEAQTPAQLSGGMRQRVGLARALCADADIILMDEPFSALDPLVRGQLQAELLALHRDVGKTIVFVTHDLDEALRLGQRVALLRDGRLVQQGTPADILTRPADDQVAAFTAGINRARAWRVSAATVAWPPGSPMPPWEDAVDEDAALEQVLHRLLGQATPVAVRRAQTVVGQLSVEKVRALLAR